MCRFRSRDAYSLGCRAVLTIKAVEESLSRTAGNRHPQTNPFVACRAVIDDPQEAPPLQDSWDSAFIVPHRRRFANLWRKSHDANKRNLFPRLHSLPHPSSPHAARKAGRLRSSFDDPPTLPRRVVGSCLATAEDRRRTWKRPVPTCKNSVQTCENCGVFKGPGQNEKKSPAAVDFVRRSDRLLIPQARASSTALHLRAGIFPAISEKVTKGHLTIRRRQRYSLRPTGNKARLRVPVRPGSPGRTAALRRRPSKPRQRFRRTDV